MNIVLKVWVHICSLESLYLVFRTFFRSCPGSENLKFIKWLHACSEHCLLSLTGTWGCHFDSEIVIWFYNSISSHLQFIQNQNMSTEGNTFPCFSKREITANFSKLLIIHVCVFVQIWDFKTIKINHTYKQRPKFTFFYRSDLICSRKRNFGVRLFKVSI